MSKLLFSVSKAILALLIIVSSQANASAILKIENGILVGASKILVNDKYYDVHFGYGTCSSLSGGCASASMVFPSSSEALLASSALLNQVFIGRFEKESSSVQGCSFDSFCDVYTPYSFGEHSAVYHEGDLLNSYSHITHDNSIFGRNDFGIGTGKGSDFSAVWADWRVSPVPELKGFEMFAPGVCFLLVFSWVLKLKNRVIRGDVLPG